VTRVTSVLLFLFVVSLVGCGGSNESTNVADGADSQEIADYEAMIEEAELADDAAGEATEE
jgi:hypothetical protein